MGAHIHTHTYIHTDRLCLACCFLRQFIYIKSVSHAKYENENTPTVSEDSICIVLCKVAVTTQSKVTASLYFSVRLEKC